MSIYSNKEIFMKKFPKDFIWGTATSAYQVEGAWEKETDPEEELLLVSAGDPGKRIAGVKFN